VLGDCHVTKLAGFWGQRDDGAGTPER
jgi:hypothetical protein